MKFNILVTILAGISIAPYAFASPMRVVVITNHQDFPPNLPFGHDAGNNLNPTMIHEAGPHQNLPNIGRHPCHLSRLSEGAIHLSNTFRQVFGLPLVEINPRPNARMPDGLVHIMPILPPGHDFPPGQPPYHHYNHHHRHHKRPFLRRIHHALMSLGRWEGRAVAFVIGCGIGVLLRMIWVMALVTYRMIKGGRVEPHYIEIVCEHDVADFPPQYIQEKAVLADVDAKKPADQA